MQLKNGTGTQQLKIGVVGAGSWGTALANLLASKGFGIDLWVFEKEVKDQILEFRENKIYLPNVKLPSNLHPSNNLASVVSDKELLLIVVPSHVMRETSSKMASHISDETILASAPKGIENNTHLTMTGVLHETLKSIPRKQLAVISGPSFAQEVAKKFPTAVTVASEDIEVAEKVQRVLAAEHFRVYTSQDVIGVEMGGSLKNVIAIAAGIIDGLEYKSCFDHQADDGNKTTWAKNRCQSANLYRSSRLWGFNSYLHWASK